MNRPNVRPDRSKTQKQMRRATRSVAMKAAAALFCWLLLCAAPVSSGTGPTIAVSINDRSSDLHALLISQKVVVPMRALFAALRASIRYDSRLHTVYARSGSHRVELTIGTHGSRLVHFRTYIPIRYVAEVLGAAVDYDSSTRSVAIYSATGSTVPADGLSISHRYPEPGQRLTGAYSIAATITSINGTTLKRNHLHMFLDGIDVAKGAEFDGRSVFYRPPRELDYGRHDVRLEALDEQGHRFSSEWWWFQALANQTYSGYSGYSGYNGFGYPPYSNGINLGFRFYPTGAVTYFTGDVIQLILVAPVGGSAFVRLCAVPQIYYLNYNSAFNYYAVSVPAPIGFYLPGCAVTAIYNSSSGAQRVIPLRSRINIFTKPRPRTEPLRRLATPMPVRSVVPLPLRRREKPPPTISRPPLHR